MIGGRGPVPREQEVRRMKHSPGSGVLSVSMVPDGPTRILRVVDENKKVCDLMERERVREQESERPQLPIIPPPPISS